jgi:hypothetical protein
MLNDFGGAGGYTRGRSRSTRMGSNGYRPDSFHDAITTSEAKALLRAFSIANLRASLYAEAV